MFDPDVKEAEQYLSKFVFKILRTSFDTIGIIAVIAESCDVSDIPSCALTVARDISSNFINGLFITPEAMLYVLAL